MDPDLATNITKDPFGIRIPNPDLFLVPNFDRRALKLHFKPLLKLGVRLKIPKHDATQ
jgi:hypothetical protein